MSAAHIPHLLIDTPWTDAELALRSDQIRHLEKVLYVRAGDPISYTDGEGTLGSGVYGNGVVIRGEETSVNRPPRPPIAISPPKERNRLRFAVEKLTELGVPRLTFLKSNFGEGRPASPQKLDAWIRAGVEQSRGAWTMKYHPESVPVGEVEPVWLAHPGGQDPSQYDGGTIAIGPEGGFDDTEVAGHRLIDLGPTVLRVETAAIVAATVVSV